MTRQRIAYFIEAALQIVALGLLTMLTPLTILFETWNLFSFPEWVTYYYNLFSAQKYVFFQSCHNCIIMKV